MPLLATRRAEFSGTLGAADIFATIFHPASCPNTTHMTVRSASTSITRIGVLVIGTLFLTDTNAQWTPLTAGIQSIRSLTADGGALYAATYPSGVKKSTDGGDNWNPVNTGLPQSGSNYFVESVGRNSSYLFAGTQSGIYRSNDAGASWNPANGTLTASNTVFANKFFDFGGVTMAVFNGDILSGGGIWRTSNNGTTWTIGHSGMGSNAKVYDLVEQSGVLYAATSVGLYTSSDNGLSWQLNAVMNYSCYALASISGTLVAITTFGYQYSTNSGSSWNNATGGPANPSTGELRAFDGKVYANTVSGTGCLVSINNGGSWAAANGGLSAIDQTALTEFLVSGGVLYVGALFEVYSIMGSGMGVAHLQVGGLSITPSVFSEGFTVDGLDGSSGILELVDAQGRTVRTQAVNDATVYIPREMLRGGAYSLVLHSGNGRTFLGRVVAY